MKIFKFGGASVKNAAAVRNVAAVLDLYRGDEIFVVVSAMDKTTNALEKLVKAYYYKDGDPLTELDRVKKFHHKIMEELFADKANPVYDDVNNSFVEIEWLIEEEPACGRQGFDFTYDQIVSIGEMVSSRILSAFLNEEGKPNRWVDVRDIIKTDNTYRDAKVDWEKSKEASLSLPNSRKEKILVTQGFIGVTSENFTTTLGREGSDYSAAILAYLTDAESVTIWKDVPGFLNADPKWFDPTVKLRNISYYEAIELSYYGASVIHPKTIQPLHKKNIPLFVNSFVSPKEEGTVINENTASDSLVPSFIFKMNQVLISILPKDYSFIVEENLSGIFASFAKHRVKINLMQNSALSFSVSVDFDDKKIPALIEELRSSYQVRFNENLELVTIRHYDQPTIDRVTVGKEILVEQKSRQTARMVMRDLNNYNR